MPGDGCTTVPNSQTKLRFRERKEFLQVGKGGGFLCPRAAWFLSLTKVWNDVGRTFPRQCLPPTRALPTWEQESLSPWHRLGLEKEKT